MIFVRLNVTTTLRHFHAIFYFPSEQSLLPLTLGLSLFFSCSSSRRDLRFLLFNQSAELSLSVALIDDRDKRREIAPAKRKRDFRFLWLPDYAEENFSISRMKKLMPRSTSLGRGSDCSSRSSTNLGQWIKRVENSRNDSLAVEQFRKFSSFTRNIMLRHSLR